MHNRLLEIFHKLHHQYGPLYWWPAETPFEVCIGAILTQNTNWANVEKAIANLKRSSLLTPQAIMELPIAHLAQEIRPSGYYNVKSRRVKEFVTHLCSHYQGVLDLMFRTPADDLRIELLAIKGIGRETCDSILLYAGNIPSFVVDAYTIRLFTRLGMLSGSPGYEQTRSFFMSNLPTDTGLYNEFHALIVQHCKHFCRKDPRCGGCPLSGLCCFGDARPEGKNRNQLLK
jgi:endonuclease-3 related protein